MFLRRYILMILIGVFGYANKLSSQCTEIVDDIDPTPIQIIDRTYCSDGTTLIDGTIIPPSRSCPEGFSYEFAVGTDFDDPFDLDGLVWSSSLPVTDLSNHLIIYNRCVCDDNAMIFARAFGNTIIPRSCAGIDCELEGCSSFPWDGINNN